MRKAIDDLRDIIQDEEEMSREEGMPVPINCEIEIEASLAYRLIAEWPGEDLEEHQKRRKAAALKSLGEVYDFVRLL